ncbi:CvpA family protein [Sediminibacillus massiliensis]|uniref:CvpA family protein n=1 Tax=Sediminibacillus massiliensis TaxID=1926277 RepID=UPI0009886327|nr:CvpA family protein [Sediminibacillus massiliensis]
MIDLVLLLILIFGFFIGIKRGFVLQLFHLIGFIAAFIVAVLYYDDLAPRLQLWIPYPDLPDDSSWAIFLGSTSMEQAFYNAIAFAIIFFGARIILQIIASMLDFIAALPILSSINSLLGGILGFIEIYLLLFLFLYIGALVPVEFVQTILEHSAIASFIIENTPFISNQIKNLWFENVADFFNDQIKNS